MFERAAAFFVPRISRWFPRAVRGIARWAPPPDRVRLMNLVTGYWTSQAVSVAAQLAIPDLIGGSARNAQELAPLLGVQPGPLYRLLRALSSIEILREDADGRFGLTRLGALLVSDQPGSLRAIAAASGTEWFRAWGELRYSVTTGACAFDKVYGKGFFDYLKEHPPLQELFDQGMRGFSSMTDLAVALAYDFSKVGRIADIGAGTGSQIAAILRLYPRLEGIVFDLTSVAARAERDFESSADVRRRVRFVGGDFTVDVPGGSDAYLLKNVLHDWSDEQAVEILRNCRRRMRSGNILLVIENAILPGSRPQFGKIFDLMMLVSFDGKERTLEEHRGLLKKAGFRVSAHIPTLAELTVIEAIAA